VAELTDEVLALFRAKTFAWVTTVSPDGSLHTTVVWVDADDEGIFFNTAVDRAKERHLRADPRVSVGVTDPEDPYRMASVSGTATLSLEGAEETIDALAKKYLGVDSYPGRTEGERRINVRVIPEKVLYNG
jgi:PPOX class probable F420-dependent enzyme